MTTRPEPTPEILASIERASYTLPGGEFRMERFLLSQGAQDYLRAANAWDVEQALERFVERDG